MGSFCVRGGPSDFRAGFALVEMKDWHDVAPVRKHDDGV